MAQPALPQPADRMQPAVAHQMTRLRREIRRRLLTVASVERLTPRMQRIRLISPELHDFDSAAPDDHIKLFLPVGEAHCMRDYTPRAFDAVRGELTLDFALHDAGPATDWALRAQPGDRLEIGGPRGSTIIPDDFDWYLLVGDETALPAIARRVEELRPGVPVTTLVLVEDAAEVQALQTRADWRPRWLFRVAPGIAEADIQGLADTDILARALRDFIPPPGDGFVWIAGEARLARSLRDIMLERGHPRAWLKAAGYWVRGAAGASEKLQD